MTAQFYDSGLKNNNKRWAEGKIKKRDILK